MSRIISYPILFTVASGDLLPITDISDPVKPLKNVTLTTLREFVNDGATLQRVISTGNTYQKDGSSVLWTWDDATLQVDGSSGENGYASIFASKYVRFKSNAFPNYTTLGNGSLIIPLPGAVNTAFRLNANPLMEAGQETEILSPATSGTLALTTDIIDSPWDTVSGGINYAGGNVEVDEGDIEVVDSASGLILRSPDGTRYRITVANGSALSVAAV